MADVSEDDYDEVDGDDHDALRTTPRIGGEPYSWKKLCDIDRQISKTSVDQITHALSFTWNEMQDIRKRIRAILRSPSGRTAVEEKKFNGRVIYQLPGELLKYWQEDVDQASFDFLSERGIYDKCREAIPVFSIPLKENAGGDMEVDFQETNENAIADPADDTHHREIAFPDFDMRTRILHRLVAHKMDYMKQIKDARDPGMEGHIKRRCRWRGKQTLLGQSLPSRARAVTDTTRLKPGGIAVAISFVNHHHDYHESHTIPGVDTLFAPPLNGYQRLYAFPFDRIDTRSLWNEVKKVPSIQHQRPWEHGWLRYQLQVGEETWTWRIKRGDELGALLEAWFARYQLATTKPKPYVQLEYVEGRCTLVPKDPRDHPKTLLE